MPIKSLINEDDFKLGTANPFHEDTKHQEVDVSLRQDSRYRLKQIFIEDLHEFVSIEIFSNAYSRQ